MSFVESYTLIWSGIFVGMALASLLYWLLSPSMKRSWYGTFAAAFVLCAIGVRPLIDWLVA